MIKQARLNLKHKTKKIKQILFTNKKMSMFIISLVIIGVVVGALYVTILKAEDKTVIENEITNFFTKIEKNESVISIDHFINSLVSNILYVSAIWVLGISIIGIPIIVLLTFFKGFITGFSIGSIIYVYKLKGSIISLFYIFPHYIINIMVIILVSYYALTLANNMFKSLVHKKTLNFKDGINNYYKILFFCIILTITSSLIEIFISPYLINLISFLL